MQPGATLTWTRTFTEHDVRTFGEVSGDQGSHHLVPNDQGRLMVQGLLTATLPSKLGGDIDFIASEMTFRFHRPVFVGDTVACTVTIDQVEAKAGRSHLSCSWMCTNQEGHTVMTGGSRGIVRSNISPSNQAAA